ncbi:MAG: ABC transporter permease [Lentisphaerae bacterium]|nr:ABC transporter permease [Lentisphaerota bacterium]
MFVYVVRRLILSVVTLLVIMFVSYCMLRLAPGDPTRSNFLDSSNAGISDSEKSEFYQNDSMRVKLKLDKSIIRGFYEWMCEVVTHGDFGESATVEPGRPVVDMIKERLPVTVKLNLLAITVSYLLAVIIGVYSARFAESLFDRGSGFVLFMLYSLPVMWVGIMLQSTFCAGGTFNVFPLRGVFDPPAEMGSFKALLMELYHYTLPAICLAYGSMTALARYTRSNMLEVLNCDFIRTARAKGLSGNQVLWKHAFRNTLITLITLFSGLLPSLIAGSIIVESIFNIPGMGSLSIQALSSRDYPLQMVLFTFSGALTLLSILIADLLYTVADPRIKLN